MSEDFDDILIYSTSLDLHIDHLKSVLCVHNLREFHWLNRWIKKYADSENLFFEDFKNAYVKLVNSGVGGIAYKFRSWMFQLPLKGQLAFLLTF